MMLISVKRDSLDKCEKITYTFRLVDLCLVFHEYTRLGRETRRHNWKRTHYWSSHIMNDSNVPEPDVPSVIKDEAEEEVISMIKVYTWKEWKNK